MITFCFNSLQPELKHPSEMSTFPKKTIATKCAKCAKCDIPNTLCWAHDTDVTEYQKVEVENGFTPPKNFHLLDENITFGDNGASAAASDAASDGASAAAVAGGDGGPPGGAGAVQELTDVNAQFIEGAVPVDELMRIYRCVLEGAGYTVEYIETGSVLSAKRDDHHYVFTSVHNCIPYLQRVKMDKGCHTKIRAGQTISAMCKNMTPDSFERLNCMMYVAGYNGVYDDFDHYPCVHMRADGNYDIMVPDVNIRKSFQKVLMTLLPDEVVAKIRKPTASATQRSNGPHNGNGSKGAHNGNGSKGPHNGNGSVKSGRPKGRND